MGDDDDGGGDGGVDAGINGVGGVLDNDKFAANEMGLDADAPDSLIVEFMLAAASVDGIVPRSTTGALPSPSHTAL